MQEYLNGKYKVILGESWNHAISENRSLNRKWYEMVPTVRGGMIYLISENPTRFAWYTTRTQLAKIIHTKVIDTELDKLDGEAVLYFPLSKLKTVLRLAGARRKRQLSEEDRKRLAELSKIYGFKSHDNMVECPISDSEISKEKN